MRLSSELRAERENGLDARVKQPVMSDVSAVSSPLGLGRDPVRRREDHRLGKDRDLPAGDSGDARVVSGLVVAARLSRTCFSTPTSSSSTRWLRIAETSMYLLEYVSASVLPSSEPIQKQLYSLRQQAVWPPGSADTVCPRQSVTLTFDLLTLKLV